MIPSILSAGLVAATLLVSRSEALQNVTRTGRYLYTADGNRFFIKGVAYQEQGATSSDPNNPFLEPSSFIDSLADGAGCARDLPFLQELGINTIRAYSVNASLNHDDCMNTFANANIYTIIDLSLPTNGSIDRDAPSWQTNLLDLYIETINAFNKYPNVLAYNVGNEVVINPGETPTAAFIKAAARDTKAYLNSIGSSALVGYASIDGDSSWLDPLANYLSCDPSNANSGSSSIDLFGLNNYEFCGNASASVYNQRNSDFAGYNVAAYFSEFGCITSPPRLWTEVGALFSSPMTDIWSGGLAFSYFPDVDSEGQHGMVTLSPDGSNVTVSDDFTRLQQQYSLVDPPNSPSQSSSPSLGFPQCPQQNSTWLASSSLPPTPNDAACACLANEVSCQFTPQTSNTTAIVGTLIDTACQFLGQAGGSCDDIAANGTTGVYGRVSFCDPSTKLSYVMSEYYEATGDAATSCDFGGNATVHSGVPATKSAAISAATSCLANPSAVFTPTAPTTSGSSSGSGSKSGSGSGSSGSGSGNSNAALPSFGSREAWMGIAISAICSVVGAALTLA